MDDIMMKTVWFHCKLALLIFTYFRGVWLKEELDFFPIEFSFQVIAAVGEQKASKALREAAGVIAESPSALQASDFF